jgi:hypothetical protein
MLAENVIQLLVVIGHLLRLQAGHPISTCFSPDVFLEISGYFLLIQEVVVSRW